jgi:hypothetical protein
MEDLVINGNDKYQNSENQEKLAELATRGETCLISLMNSSFQLFRALKDISTPPIVLKHSNENASLILQETKHKCLQDAQELKVITKEIKVRQSCTKF